jgi:hypothetical protein
MANHHDPAFGNLDSIAALRTWAQRIVEQQRAQNFEGGCRLGSLAADQERERHEPQPLLLGAVVDEVAANG